MESGKIRDGLKIGPAGNSESFYSQGHKHTYEAAEWLNKLGLNAFEYSFGRGISASPETLTKINQHMTQHGIQVSAHAPYYTNFVNADAEMIAKTFNYVRQSIAAVKLMGGNRVVVHPGSVGSLTRTDALGTAMMNIEKMAGFLNDSGLGDCLICIETLGKLWQIGTIDEVLAMVKPYKNFIPCIDFGHINSYTLGGLKTKDDYKRIIDLTFNELGQERAKIIHIHFSKIMFGKSGEIKHLTFEDTEYGPEYLPLAEIIEEYKMTPTVICESNGTMAEDALTIKSLHLQAQSKIFL